MIFSMSHATVEVLTQVQSTGALSSPVDSALTSKAAGPWYEAC